MHRVLTALDCVGSTGMREDILCNEIALDSPRHIEASSIREHLAEARRHGWAAEAPGLLREPRWSITPQGQQALRELAP